MRVQILLFLTILMLCTVAVVHAYPTEPIDSIQWAAVGHDSSRYTGDTVVTGAWLLLGWEFYMPVRVSHFS